MRKGVYQATKKDGSIYYRSSITHKGKHISLGSYDTESEAHQCYLESSHLLFSSYKISDYKENNILSFDKWVCLINLRDNGMYFKTPIYIQPKYFLYYYSMDICYKFDVDDLFYYSKHKIMKRNGHLFVEDYGMQVNILSRYGIKNFAVVGKDYEFVNGDSYDFRYKNIKIINKYNGVRAESKNGIPVYVAKIHINGDYIIGKYNSEDEAAIAYNKAGDFLVENGILQAYRENYIDGVNPIQYASIYASIKLSKKIRNLAHREEKQ